MKVQTELFSSIYQGWHHYQVILTETITALDSDQLALRTSPNLRSVGEITAHMIGARARWFHSLMGEGGEEFESFGKWDSRGAKARSSDELVRGLKTTWDGMHDTIARWTTEDWDITWPGEYDGEPEIITRQWVIWHLIEHDLHHGGEISIILGSHGIQGLDL